MKCADPVLCYTTSRTRLFRHYSLASPIFRLQAQQVFDCGSCIFCRKKRSYELAVRCVLHASLYKQNCFLTLTYDESREGYHNEFEYSDIQKFKKRLRRFAEPDRVQIFNVHEYGRNGKKHWHLVVFNWCPPDLTLHTVSNGRGLFKSAILQRLWPFGFSTVGDISEASALYTAQYTQKDVKNGNTNNRRKSHSRHSGIGRDYFLAHYDQILRLGYVPFGRKKVPIPRYFIKLAHKHWSHFFEQSNFFDTRERRALYRPFRGEEAQRSIADAYAIFSENKKERLAEVISDWDDFINENAFSNDKPDFRLAAENYLYDLNNKKSKGF